jgi:hypothetical protein
MKRFLLLLTLNLGALLAPREARAQIDAIIDAVVDAVEPTPVYDSGLREATENLASKIDRLNHVLFGGSEETSAAYRYMTMYSDLYELTTAFSGFVDRTYANAKRLERMYRELDDGDDSLHEWAAAIEGTWHAYDNTVRQGSAIVARFKKLFSDPNTTNAEVRAAAREAVAELRREQLEIDRALEREMALAELSAGLVESSIIMDVSPKAYIAEGKRTYGTTISSGGDGSSIGVLGTAVMVVIGLLCVVYALFAGIHIMRGSVNAERALSRLLFFFVFALIIILAIQGSI